MTKKSTPQPTRTYEQSREALRKKVRNFYDIQRVRIACGGRTKPKADGKAAVLHQVDIALFESREKELMKQERAAMRDVEEHLKTMPIWTEVLSDKTRFKGLGPTMAGVILSEIDIYKADTVSKIWSFAGLLPIPCRRCKKCSCLVKEVGDDPMGPFEHSTNVMFKKCPHFKAKNMSIEHTFASGRAQRPERGKKLPYNKWLRTKLLGVMGTNFLRGPSPFKKFYDDYKHRKASAGWGTSDGHRHQAAIRYMVKMFLIDVYEEWRAIEGLPVRPPYQEEYLGHVHSA